jgi:anti-sigma regulatory factor (Ser/Thr protein kinase)
VEGVDAARSATVVYAVLEPTTSRVRYSCAGHLPPLIVTADGHAEYLMDGRGVPLGALPDTDRTAGQAVLPPGSTLVLYSDGLVERRGESLEVGLARLADTAAALRALPAEALCDRLVEDMVGSPQRDDVAVLTVRPASVRFHRHAPADAAQLAPLRHDLRAWFGEHAVAPDIGEELLVAVGEALSNTIDHAYLTGPQGPVELDVAILGGMVKMRVRDWGRWRAEPALGDRGRGIALMKLFCDTVDVTTGENGTSVALARAAASPPTTQ